LVTEEVLVEDLLDVADLHTHVHDSVRIDEDVWTELTGTETAGASDGDPAVGLPRFHEAAELRQQAFGVALGARPLGVAGRPGIEADKNMFFWSGHDIPFALFIDVFNALGVWDVPLDPI
jgi:hypothetical protein